MIRTLQTKNVNHRLVTGLFDSVGKIICEVKSQSMLSNDDDRSSLVVTKSVDVATRSGTGIYSVTGVVDSTLDRTHVPAFTKTIAERVVKGQKVRFLWNHDQSQPPVATITGMKTLSRDQLPGEILTDFPEATGGVEVTRQYHDTPLADSVFKNLASQGLNEMSFGFIPVSYSYTKKNEDDPEWKAIREINELKLYEVSDVHWGANPASMGLRSEVDPVSMLENWKCFVEELKSSKGLTADDRAQLAEGLELLKKMLAIGAEGTQPSTDPEAVAANDGTTTKSQPLSEAEFSLQLNRAKAQLLQY